MPNQTLTLGEVTTYVLQRKYLLTYVKSGGLGENIRGVVEYGRLGLTKCQQIDRQPNWLKHEEKAAEVCLKEEAAEVCLKQDRSDCMT